MKNRKVLSLDCIIKDNINNIENDSSVGNDARKMQSSPRELRVILRDVLKENRNRGLLYFVFNWYFNFLFFLIVT